MGSIATAKLFWLTMIKKLVNMRMMDIIETRAVFLDVYFSSIANFRLSSFVMCCTRDLTNL